MLAAVLVDAAGGMRCRDECPGGLVTLINGSEAASDSVSGVIMSWHAGHAGHNGNAELRHAVLGDALTTSLLGTEPSSCDMSATQLCIACREAEPGKAASLCWSWGFEKLMWRLC